MSNIYDPGKILEIISNNKQVLEKMCEYSTESSSEKSYGYHIEKIKKGVFGEPSKIIEEAKEFEDAMIQECSLMAIHELSDLIGAIQGWLAKYHPSLTLNDLIKMSTITQRAFINGYRT